MILKGPSEKEINKYLEKFISDSDEDDDLTDIIVQLIFYNKFESIQHLIEKGNGKININSLLSRITNELNVYEIEKIIDLLPVNSDDLRIFLNLNTFYLPSYDYKIKYLKRKKRKLMYKEFFNSIINKLKK